MAEMGPLNGWREGMRNCIVYNYVINIFLGESHSSLRLVPFEKTDSTADSHKPHARDFLRWTHVKSILSTVAYERIIREWHVESLNVVDSNIDKLLLISIP